MSLLAGQRLGPYEIVAPLGAGGMGEVYRVHDTRLGREVALKILPAHLASDADARGRFEREARSVAALNHPHILAIFDFGQDATVTYAVTELLDGKTLRELLTGDRLPPRRGLEIARQIAAGLAAAHDKGIVHRDLKLENVFVTRDGSVKILDFGLARAVTRARDNAATLATVDVQTGAGTILGTVGYMSPEQVRAGGRPSRRHLRVRCRALRDPQRPQGVSGGDRAGSDDRHPPRGSAGADARGERPAAVARSSRSPVPGEGSRASLPVGARPRLRARRHRHRRQRARLGREPARADGPAVASDRLARGAGDRRGADDRCCLRAGWRVRAARQQRTPLVAADGLSVRRAVRVQSDIRALPDGRTLAYNAPAPASQSATGSIVWIRTLDSVEARPLPTISDVARGWSADSRSVLVVNGRTLASVDVATGQRSVLGELAGPGRGVAWAADGSVIAATAQGIVRIRPGVAEPRDSDPARRRARKRGGTAVDGP